MIRWEISLHKNRVTILNSCISLLGGEAIIGTWMDRRRFSPSGIVLGVKAWTAIL